MKIAICTPVYEHPKACYTSCLARLLIRTLAERADLTLRHFLQRGHLIDARNALASDAIAWEADSILWIDADMAFPEDALLALLAHGKPVVGCNAPTRHSPPRTTVYREVSGGFQAIFSTPAIAERLPLEEVTQMGLGVALIAAPLLAALDPPLFQPKPGRGLDEDVYLFERIRQSGEKVFVDHRVSLAVTHAHEAFHTNADSVSAARGPA